MSWGGGSLASRLTRGLGLVAAVVFVATGAWLHRSLALDLEAAGRDNLAGKSRVVLHFIDEAVRSGDMAALFHHLDDLRIGHDGLHVWLFDATAAPVYGTEPLTIVRPGRAHLGPSAAQPGSTLDLLELALPAQSPWPGGLLRIGKDLRERERLLSTHLMTLVVVCTLGVVCTVVLSWFAIRRGLGVLARLSAEAAAITPASMGRRLTEQPADVELAGLVHAFNVVLDRQEAAYAQMEAFNADVAHELRTPLAALINGTQVMLAAPRPRDELCEAMASNLEELEQMNKLVSDMLFLARADRGGRAEDLVRVELGHETDKAIRYCEALLHEARVRAARQGDASMQCNAALVQRAVVNLLTNAVRHTAPGGEIVVTIEASGEAVRLWVQNPGAPIPGPVRERMFDRFFRAEPSRTRSGPSLGLGLGLAIVAATVRMHGGAVFADRVGAVNRVGFTLPRIPTPSAAQG